MTRSICMDCFKTVDDKNIKWYPDIDGRDTQMCIKCYGKHIKYDLLKDISEEERKELTLELMEIMELLHNGNLL